MIEQIAHEADGLESWMRRFLADVVRLSHCLEGGATAPCVEIEDLLHRIGRFDSARPQADEWHGLYARVLDITRRVSPAALRSDRGVRERLRSVTQFLTENADLAP